MWNMYIYSSAHKLYKHYGVNMFTYSYPSSCLGSHKERCGGNHKLERDSLPKSSPIKAILLHGHIPATIPV